MLLDLLLILLYNNHIPHRNNYRYYNYGWYGRMITDPNEFIFSLRNNGRSSEMIKIPIKKENSDWTFSLFKKEREILFRIGL